MLVTRSHATRNAWQLARTAGRVAHDANDWRKYAGRGHRPLAGAGQLPLR